MPQVDVRNILKDALDREGVGQLAPFAEAIWGQESSKASGNVAGPTTSSGEKARSPFQIMPATARALGYTGSDSDLERPEVAAPFMAKLLAQDFKRFGGNYGDMAAAYYSGDAKKDASGKYLGGPPAGVPGPSTDEYSRSILSRMGGQGQEGSPTMAATFVPADTNKIIEDNFKDRQSILDGLKPTAEYEGMFSDIANLINKQQAPAQQPVPQRVSPLARAIAGFAGGMNAVQTGNGQVLQNATNAIRQQDQEASNVEANNFSTKLQFDQNKQEQLLNLKMKILEMKRNEAIKAGDRDLALKMAEQELKLQAILKKEAEDSSNAQTDKEIAQKHKNELEEIDATTAGRLKAIDRKASVTSIMDGYGVPREVAQQMHDHRQAITLAFNTQMQALGSIASLPDAKAAQLRAELQQALLDSDKNLLDTYGAKQPAAPQAAPDAAPAAPVSAAPALAPPDTAAAAQPDTSVARPGRGRLGL